MNVGGVEAFEWRLLSFEQALEVADVTHYVLAGVEELDTRFRMDFDSTKAMGVEHFSSFRL